MESHPVQVWYYLTPSGESLAGLIARLYEWGDKNCRWSSGFLPNADSRRYVVKCTAGKWKGFLLLDLSLLGIGRFSKMARYLGVSKKVLKCQLDDLEDCGLVGRKDFHEKSPHVEYSITPTGRSLVSLLVEFYEWSRGHMIVSGVKPGERGERVYQAYLNESQPFGHLVSYWR